MTKEEEKDEVSEDVNLEDILSSIRGIINDHKNATISESNDSEEGDKSDFDELYESEDEVRDEEILELTDLYNDRPGDFSAADSAKITDDGLDDGLVADTARAQTAAVLNEFASKASVSKYSEPTDHTQGDLEAMLGRMMRPMLKEWLDDNLPNIVEKIVTREIKKLVPRR